MERAVSGGEQLFEKPTPLVDRFVPKAPGTALDLACGAGRNALYLAERGWRVTAVDGSPVAIGILTARAREKGIHVDARVADLERGEFAIQPDAYDLICDCYYLQRDLIPVMKSAVRAGGTIIAIVHLAAPDQPDGTPMRARPRELEAYFADWTVLHSYEGLPSESCHHRAVAEVVARKPLAMD